MLICMDIHFIETARVQGLRGADVIVHISNWLAEKTPAPYWLTRAFDNGC
jgi:predicted amidohydrolase